MRTITVAINGINSFVYLIAFWLSLGLAVAIGCVWVTLYPAHGAEDENWFSQPGDGVAIEELALLVYDELGRLILLLELQEACRKLFGEEHCRFQFELVDDRLILRNVSIFVVGEPWLVVDYGDNSHQNLYGEDVSEKVDAILIAIEDVLAFGQYFRVEGDISLVAHLKGFHIRPALDSLCSPKVTCRLDFVLLEGDKIALAGVNLAEGYDTFPEETRFFCVTVRKAGQMIPRQGESGHACTSSTDEAVEFLVGEADLPLPETSN